MKGKGGTEFKVRTRRRGRGIVRGRGMGGRHLLPLYNDLVAQKIHITRQLLSELVLLLLVMRNLLSDSSELLNLFAHLI